MLTLARYYYFLLYLVKIAYSQDFNETSCCNLTDLNFGTDVNLIYYKCNNETPATINFPITEPQELLKALDNNTRVIFVIFGFHQVANSSNVQLILEALCDERTDNVVLLDWGKYSSKGDYPKVFQNAMKVGNLFARSIRLLVEDGLDVSKIYLIGFSLGAHIAGFVTRCNNFVVPRITGLDPANYKLYNSTCYLKPSDAEWIDVIHTDMDGYGTPSCIEAVPSDACMGTAEYFVNRGSRVQPGCPLNPVPFSSEDSCSHERALQIYAISKCQPGKFIAVKCLSYLDYKSGMCKSNLQTGVGYNASNVRGKFYFSTEVINITNNEDISNDICEYL